jgi:hypothetical protein
MSVISAPAFSAIHHAPLRYEDTHFSYIVSRRFHVAMDDGAALDLGPGDVAIIMPGHDAWVIGDEPCVAIDIQVVSRNA